MRVPAVGVVERVVRSLQAWGLEPALGGSGLLVALGLAEVANDWDLTVDAAEEAVRGALDAGGLRYSDGTSGDPLYATRRRFVIDGGDHDVDLLVGFALRSPDGDVVPLPTRVTGWWKGLPLADPVVWEQAYVLLGRPEKAAVLRRWLASGSDGWFPGGRAAWEDRGVE